MTINKRQKGMRNERKGRTLLETWGYRVFPLFQPKFSPQGCLDAIAVGHGRIRFVQMRTNTWHSLKDLQQFATEVGTKPLVPSVEAWLFKNGQKEPVQRVMET